MGEKREKDPGELSRREVLQIGGVVAAGVLAGCGGGGGGADGGRDADADDAATDAPLDSDLDGGLPETGPDADSADAEVEVGPDADAEADADEDAGPASPGPLILLHLTDLHIGAQRMSGPAMAHALRDVVPVVAPDLTVATGDLSDQGYDVGFWEEYAAVASAAEAGRFVEVPGNHDAHDDFGHTNYLTYSVTGRETAGRHGHRVLEAGGRRIRVVGTNTASAGDRLRNLTGYLDGAQVDALLESIAHDPVPADATVVLGHHPLRGVNGLDLQGTGDNLRRLLAETGASAYLFGHVHLFQSSWGGDVLHVQGPTLGKPSFFTTAGYCLFALDDDGPAVREVEVEVDGASIATPWPLVLITRPGDRGLGGGNPVGGLLARGSRGNLVRAAVFAPGGPDEVSLSVAGGEFAPMAVGPRWYEALFDAPDAASTTLEVRATAAGRTARHSIRVAFA